MECENSFNVLLLHSHINTLKFAVAFVVFENELEELPNSNLKMAAEAQKNMQLLL